MIKIGARVHNYTFSSLQERKTTNSKIFQMFFWKYNKFFESITMLNENIYIQKLKIDECTHKLSFQTSKKIIKKLFEFKDLLVF
jgi:hypothetical protein